MKYIFVLIEFKNTEFFTSHRAYLPNNTLVSDFQSRSKFRFLLISKLIVYCRHSDLDFYAKLHFDSDFSPKSDSGEKDKILRKAIEKYGYGLLKTVSKHL